MPFVGLELLFSNDVSRFEEHNRVERVFVSFLRAKKKHSEEIPWCAVGVPGKKQLITFVFTFPVFPRSFIFFYV